MKKAYTLLTLVTSIFLPSYVFCSDPIIQDTEDKKDTLVYRIDKNGNKFPLYFTEEKYPEGGEEGVRNGKRGEKISEALEVEESIDPFNFLSSEKSQGKTISQSDPSPQEMVLKGSKKIPEDFLGLSIDGGGMRGICPALWLEHLEKEVGGDLIKVYDCMSGTSIGGIEALGLSKGMKASEFVDLFKKRGQQIFIQNTNYSKWNEYIPRKIPKILTNLVSYFIPDSIKKPANKLVSQKYSRIGLDKLLDEYFEKGDIFGSAQTDVLVTSCTTSGVPLLFTNINEAHKYIKMGDIAKATSAAPTYFPAHSVSVDGETLKLIDGGIWVNNPSLLNAGYLMRKNNVSPSQIHVLSLGTGQSTQPKIIPKNAGMINVASIVDSLMSSHSIGNHHSMKALFGDNYTRIDVSLEEDIALDVIEPKVLKELEEKAQSVFHRIDQYIKKYEDVIRKKLDKKD